VRYVVHVPPAGVAPPLGAAITPRMTRTYAGWSSRGPIYGAPGTRAIQSPTPPATNQGVIGLAATGRSRSSDAPDYIFPALYWEASPPLEKEKFPASVFSDNQMPVPAGKPVNVVIADPFRARHGGQRQVVQPQVVQSFPAWRGRLGSSGR